MAGLVKEKKPLASRAAFWVPVGTVLLGGGGALAYLLLNSESTGQPENVQEVQLEVPLQ